jgi:hypothetical protein
MPSPSGEPGQERSNRCRELRLRDRRGQGPASRQNFGYRAGGRTSEVTVNPFRAEGGARDATEPPGVRGGAAGALSGGDACRERYPPKRGRHRHRPAPQGGDPSAAPPAAGADGAIARGDGGTQGLGAGGAYRMAISMLLCPSTARTSASEAPRHDEVAGGGVGAGRGSGSRPAWPLRRPLEGGADGPAASTPGHNRGVGARARCSSNRPAAWRRRQHRRGRLYVD